ncbi:polyprenol reductase-like [Acanthaster planci]|uniref:Polyprenal reductase n=1 Tax=Acanthaster planci TaxID=133434 RepID=A0A8B8A0N1_ACAPL|nr:polyprenol reductase-like [Acanthaster planci]
MLPLNILACFWLLCIGGFCSMFIIQQFPKIPSVLWNLISYGKARNLREEKTRKRSSLDKLLDLPKQWFTHFYAVSVICNGFLLFKLFEVLFFHGHMPNWYMDLLRFLTNFPLQTPKASHLSIVIAIALLLFQGIRRLYECLFVSSYSSSTMHVAHYILGILFYALAGMSVLSEGPDFRKPAPFDNAWQVVQQVEWFNVAGIIVFFWATYHHHVAHKIFAGLRKGDRDRSHRIPRGDWFELVSCPHYLAEILIYVALVMVLGFAHPMSYLVLGFTASNQVFASISVHAWYQKTFDNYPKGRRAIIPWLI